MFYRKGLSDAGGTLKAADQICSGRGAASRPLDGLLALNAACRVADWWFILFRDWSLRVYGWPQFFKHRINLARWDAEPHRGLSWRAASTHGRECSWLHRARFVYATRTYSRLFFSDIASQIDAWTTIRFALRYPDATTRRPHFLS